MSKLIVEQAKRIARDQVGGLDCPWGTSTWSPLPHGQFLSAIEDEVENVGFVMENMELSVMDGRMKSYSTGEMETIPDARFFGHATLVSKNGNHAADQEALGYHPVIGFRNTNDKKFAASMALGSQVMVCDNLCFSGDIMVSRVHVGNVLANFQHDVYLACVQLAGAIQSQNERIEKYKESHLFDTRFHDFTIALVDEKIIAASAVPKLLKEWREPEHDEFKPRTVYSAMNATTEVFKSMNQLNLTKKGRKLHEICDKYVAV